MIEGTKQGDAPCYNQLGVLYGLGLGVTQDFNLSFEYYKTGAESGDSLAMANIGYMYENGHGTKKDMEKAVLWYKKAAEQGNAEAIKALQNEG